MHLLTNIQVIRVDLHKHIDLLQYSELMHVEWIFIYFIKYVPILLCVKQESKRVSLLLSPRLDNVVVQI